MDGVPGVTQDPVEPGENFIYRLKLEDAGTFWYHPHFNSSEQLERGLKGVFIVEDAEKQPWSQDWVWLMDDWLLQNVRKGKSGENMEFKRHSGWQVWNRVDHEPEAVARC